MTIMKNAERGKGSRFRESIMRLSIGLLLAAIPVPGVEAQESADGPGRVGVVTHVKVLSDKVADISSMEAWKRTHIKDGMTDREKVLAIWRTVYTYQHQDSPPREFLQQHGGVQDPIKIYNVYGYAQCGMASAEIAALARYVGLKARGRILSRHSVPEVYWDGAWHLLDASLINYFPKADGTIASVDEIMAGLKDWYGKNPGFKGNDRKLREFMRRGGWRKGPEILSRSTAYNNNGWLPAATHGWYSSMQEYDGSATGFYEYGYSQGYRVNVRLRQGERLVRNWSHKGLHVNMKDGSAPGCLKMKVGQSSLRYTPKTGDLANGRVGNGTREYDVPLSGTAWRDGAIRVENLEVRRGGPGVRVRDASRPGTLVLGMPSSYVYLTGTLELGAAVGRDGSVAVSFSDNNGLDWREIARVTESGSKRIDLNSAVFRRYDYRLRLELKGAGTGLDRIRLAHDIQHSQRPLPALGKGSNTITFSAGPGEGTVTIEGSTNPKAKGKQLVYTDFHPDVENVGPPSILATGRAHVTFPVETPGDLVRLRFGCHYRARDKRNGWDFQVSFDGGKTFKTVDRAAGPTPGHCHYTVFSDVPPGTRKAHVRFAGGPPRNALMIFDFRIDADYREPRGGFRPVKVTYRWEEGGAAKEHVFTARSARETRTIECRERPVMKSISLELAR